MKRHDHAVLRALAGLVFGGDRGRVRPGANRTDAFVDSVMRREGFSATDLRALDEGAAVVKSLRDAGPQ